MLWRGDCDGELTALCWPLCALQVLVDKYNLIPAETGNAESDVKSMLAPVPV